MSKNAFYAQSGGVTAVINASAAGVITAVRENLASIPKLYIGKNGILGALEDKVIDSASLSCEQVALLKQTPGGHFGSCRYKLKPLATDASDYEKILAFFKKYDIGYFFYNGGGDSQDTANKVAIYSQEQGFPVKCIGIPKTIDNDLPLTDACPGFGSVAKYVAIATLEASLDVASMAKTSTKVFILEVMGRHAGWIAAASGIIRHSPNLAPHMILFPELNFVASDFLKTVQTTIAQYGYCVIVASEGIKSDGKFVSEQGSKDAFGHAQLGGVASYLAALIKQQLGHKCHYAVADYLQRAARHIASSFDVELAYQVGRKAIELALSGHNSVLPIMVRTSNKPFTWHLEAAPLTEVANVERKLPKEFISDDGYSITELAREYLLPLIQGEAYPSYKLGIPNYLPPME